LTSLSSQGISSHTARAAATLAFITGCGRSGTTILGRILAQHPHITYLNDRFDLWTRPLPVTDIWGKDGCETHDLPRIWLTEDDARSLAPDARRRFLARLEEERRGRPLLIEKLAINNFRLGFLVELCPEARLINIVRHGVEVARSIERRAGAGAWYGRDGRKWAFLAAHARERGLDHLLALCTGDYERGLLEWRLSIEAAADYFTRAGPSPHTVLHVRYEDLVADAPRTCDQLAVFLGLSPDSAMRDFCTREVRRQNPSVDDLPIPPSTGPIAGEVLARLGYDF
jgi:hypothetical protein